MNYLAVICALLAVVVVVLQLTKASNSTPEVQQEPLCHYCDKSLRLVQAREIKVVYDYARLDKYSETTPKGATHYCNCKDVTKYYTYKYKQEEV